MVDAEGEKMDAKVKILEEIDIGDGTRETT